jgi:hypothetical protein
MIRASTPSAMHVPQHKSKSSQIFEGSALLTDEWPAFFFS